MKITQGKTDLYSYPTRLKQFLNVIMWNKCRHMNDWCEEKVEEEHDAINNESKLKYFELL